MSSLLQRIVNNKLAEVAALRAVAPEGSAPKQNSPRGFEAALRKPGLSVIAEIKRRSPSKGGLNESLDPAALARQYEAAGAAAVSCLTDRQFFGALPEDLRQARGAVILPVLRKDFIIDRLQVAESAAMGADAILLIARILSRNELAELHAAAREAGLDVLVEVHDEVEIERAAVCGATMIGVNNRDLNTFEVTLQTSVALRRRIPAGCVAVAESGIHTAADAQRLIDAGYDAILVGESLVTAPDPAAALAALRGHGRRP